MQILVQDRYRGAGPSREAYLQSRCRRLLGDPSHRVSSVSLTLADDDAEPDCCQTQLEVVTERGATLRASARKPRLPLALAHIFGSMESQLRARR